MIGRACDAIHLQTVRLHEMQAVNAGETHDFACAIIMFDACRDIQRRSRNAAAQRLEHRVATDDQIVGFRSELCRATACSQSRIDTLVGPFFIAIVAYCPSTPGNAMASGVRGRCKVPRS